MIVKNDRTGRSGEAEIDADVCNLRPLRNTVEKARLVSFTFSDCATKIKVYKLIQTQELLCIITSPATKSHAFVYEAVFTV